MASLSRPFLRLSPNEVEAATAEEKKKWRIFRLQQVRVQAREEAARVRTAVMKEEVNQHGKIAIQMKKQWEAQKENKLKELQEKYKSSCDQFGEAHKNAEVEIQKIEAREKKLKQSRKLANVRGSSALQKLVNDAKVLEEKENTKINNQQKLCRNEKKRAQKIASKPTPAIFKPKKPQKSPETRKVMFYEAGTFTTSSYHPKSIKVQREQRVHMSNAYETAKVESKKAAENLIEQTRLKELEQEKEREREILARRKVWIADLRAKLISNLDEADHEEISSFLETQHYPQPSHMKCDSKLDAAAERILLEMENESQREPSSSSYSSSDLKELSDFPLCVSDHKNNSSSPALDSDYADGKQPSENVMKIDENQRNVIEPVVLLPPQEVDLKSKDRFEVRSSGAETSTSSCGDVVPEQDQYEHRSSPSEDLESPQGHKSATSGKLQGASESETSDSYVSTEYYNPPDQVAPISSDFKDIWKYIQMIKSSNQNIERMIGKSSEESTSVTENTESGKNGSSSCSSSNNINLLTPQRHYTEQLKSEGSGQKLMSKKRKFDQLKRDLLRHYTQKLLTMKKDEIAPLSASSVEGSGIDVSSICSEGSFNRRLLNLHLLNSGCSSTTPSPIYSEYDSTNDSEDRHRFDDVDYFPTKLPGLGSVFSSTPCTASDIITSSTPVGTSSEDLASNSLNLVKGYRYSSSKGGFELQKWLPPKRGRTGFQTPVGENSLMEFEDPTSGSEGSTLSSLKESLAKSNFSKDSCSSSSAAYPSMPILPFKKSEASSASTSLEEMTAVLQRFGLGVGWAESMFRTMNVAEKCAASSDSSRD